MIFEEQSTLEIMVHRILTHTQSLIQCQRCQVTTEMHPYFLFFFLSNPLLSPLSSHLSFFKVLLVHEASKGTFSRVFDFDEAGDVDKADPGSGTR